MIYVGSDILLPTGSKYTTYLSVFSHKFHEKAESWFSGDHVDVFFNRVKNTDDSKVLQFRAGDPFVRMICSDTFPIHEVLLKNNSLGAYEKVARCEMLEKGDKFFEDLPYADVKISRLDKKHAVNLPNLLAYVNS